LPVNPARFPHVKRAEAMTFVEWLTGPHGQEAIRGYTIQGETLFFPNAKTAKP